MTVRRRRSGADHLLPRLVALAAALAWAPFLTKPPSPDEAGFLMLAEQWTPGPSLYGHYWVDRPPVLILAFKAGGDLGGILGVRLIGVGCVVASVLLAAHLARATSVGVTVPAVIAGVFLTTPYFGTTMVDGELLAVPLVLSAVLALVHASTSRGARSMGWALVAGAAGAGAVLVKQNVVDVFVVLMVLTAQGARQSSERRRVLVQACVATAGAALATLACLTYAWNHGTHPGPLWDAVVTFRAQATVLTHTSSTAAARSRSVALLGAATRSLAPLIVTVLALRLTGRQVTRPIGTPDLRLAAVSLLAWEATAAVAGGSYWLHYLIGLVPGLILLAVAAGQRTSSMMRTTHVALIMAVASALVALGTAALTMDRTSTDLEVAAYLRAHSGPSSSAVVAFGRPDILYDSRLPSPYPLLWSLPVRVRDSHLTRFTRLLASPRAPTWVVVAGRSLGPRSDDDGDADAVLQNRYRPDATIGPWVVWHLDPTPAQTVAVCSASRDKRSWTPGRVRLSVVPSVASSASVKQR